MASDCSTVDSNVEPCSKVIAIGSHWRGFSAVRHLIVFGDSYSTEVTTGAKHGGTAVPAPVSEPTKLDQLRDLFHMRRRPTAQQQSTLLSSPVVTARSWADWIASADDFTGRQELNVHGYAVKGARVAGLASQVDRFLSDLSLEKCGGLTRSETKEEAMLFAIWLGINDFATSQTPESMQLLLETVSEQQTRLYNEAGARNFLFVDIPPVHRTPAAARASEEQRQTLATTLKLWHTLLSTRVSSHPGISALLFSSYAFFTGLLDDPTTYGFRDEDVVNAGPTKSRIWLDELHPTSGVHRALSLSILSFLQTAAHATE